MPLFQRRPDSGLLELFEASGRNAEQASVLLRDLLASFPERAELADKVRDCEHEGDRLTHEIIRRINVRNGDGELPSSDVYQLATALDDIVDYAEEAADTLGLYGVEAPMEQAVQLAEALVTACGELCGALTAFAAGQELSPNLVAVHEAENEGDRIRREAIAALFAGGIDPMQVIRWKDILESLESAVDACETVAHILEGIQLKLSA